MQITRRQFGVAMIFGILSLALTRIFGPLVRFFSGEEKASGVAGGHPARYWKRADHLGG